MSIFDKLQQACKAAVTGNAGDDCSQFNAYDDETFSDCPDSHELAPSQDNFDRPLDSLVSVINKLQDVFNKVGGGEIQLPQIVVVGSQSSGKSSVLESIVGRDFLPRGSGIVTRCPLVLQLQHVKKDDLSIRSAESVAVELEEWGKFLHTGDKIFSDFEEIREEIIAQTDRAAGDNKGISLQPISLKIFSNRVVDLTLVDLPGITKVAVGDQPKDIEDQIRNLVLQFIKPSNSIILAVSTANTDFANSESLKMAREIDPKGDRTLAVLTKLDLMDKGTNANDVLSGSVIAVKLGIIGCVNRSQEDINRKKSISDALISEREFLQSRYPLLADRNGTTYLAKRLSSLLHKHISKCLPELKNRVAEMTGIFQKKMEVFGTPVVDKRATVYRILEKFSDAYCSIIEGTGQELKTDKLDHGARICYFFHESFSKELDRIGVRINASKRDCEILTAMKNCQGTRTSLFIPDTVFEKLVHEQIRYLEKPSMDCVDEVYNEMRQIIIQAGKCLENDLRRFPNLNYHIDDVMDELLTKRVKPTKKFVKNLIKINLGYIDAHNPDFYEARIMMENSKKKAKEEESEDEISFASMETMLMKQMKKEINIKNDPSDPDYDVVIEDSKDEKREVELIQFLRKTYFTIVRKTIQDLVPKSIMTFMVNYVKKNLRSELVSNLVLPDNSDKLLESLLAESREVCHLRQEASDMLAALKKASIIIKEVDINQNRFV